VTAERVKSLENTFRMINIGLVNELAVMCDRMGINVCEVIDAAATKPFGYMPFYPGPGLGGHCIPIDPFYLSWKSKQAGFEARFIELAGEVNGQMPRYVVERVQNALNDVEKPLKGSRVHVLGVAYKRDIDDVRESPALDVIHLLGQRERRGRADGIDSARRGAQPSRHRRGGDRPQVVQLCRGGLKGQARLRRAERDEGHLRGEHSPAVSEPRR
jgi:nucleotide sugar dehydrogenase